NKVSYTPAVAGTSADPDGTDGSYAFTITVTKGTQSQTTIQKTITITVTAYTGVTDVQAVQAAKAAISTAIINSSVSNATTGNDILTIARNATLYGVTVAWDTTNGFSKINATSSTAGTIQGTINLSRGSVTYTVEVNKIIEKLPTENGGSSSGNNSVSTPVKTEGKIEKDQKQDENAPATILNNSSEDLKSKVLSAEDQALIATGKDAKIILKVKDISTSVSEEDKKQIETKLAEEQKNTAKASLLYIDVSLFKQIGEGQESRVTETSGKISISIEIPEDMRSTMQGVDRTYYVIRIHNGVAERLSGTYDSATHLFTFETDQFSTYALTYKDKNTATDKTDENTEDKLTVYNDFSHLRLSAKATKTSQKLSYVKVSGADGYLIYGAKCGQSMKKLADVKGTVLSYTVKNLKQATYYKFQVKAYKIIDGEKVFISTSKIVHSITEDKIYANPIKVTTDEASIKLSVGKTRTVTSQVLLPKDKKLKQHTAITRFESSNKEIATVNSNGIISAKAKGTCYIYVYAQNGVYTKIKLTVK
ncbi:MAG TPA: Ig-like domain-containing protein, partial [Lachnospiraceae bacterium]|nr:Ig-like domain-containing protein [Lachnospiraceae bacterium]